MMSTAPAPADLSPATLPGGDDRSWYVVARSQEFEGELRANLVRLAAVAAFYAIELINYYGIDLGFIQLPKVSDPSFHRTVTAIATAWVLLGLGVHLWLRLRFMPAALPYVATGLDVAFLTLVLMLAGGPRSPMVVGFFVIVAMATLRFQLKLVWFATIAAIVGYLWVLGWAIWTRSVRNVRVPRHHELILLTALALVGLIGGQVIRQVKAMAAEYARRLAAARAPATDLEDSSAAGDVP